jgi:1,4-alpha-glucan branching enzyme
MRILLVTPEFPPHVLGGLGRYAAEVASALADDGVAVDVLIAPSYLGAAPITPMAGVNVLATGAVTSALQRSPPDIDEALSQARIAVAARYTNTEAYDVAYVQDYASAPIAAALLDLNVAQRVCAACHLPLYAGFTYFERTIDDDTHQVLESLLLRRASWVVAPSSFTRSVLLRTYSLFPKQVQVVPLGVARPIVASPVEPFAAPLVIGVVARFTEQKGLHFLPRLLERLDALGRPARLRVLGAGAGRARFKSIVAESGLSDRIEVLGPCDHDAIWAFLDSIDIIASVSLYETFGLSSLEAMASGKPVVAFHIAAHVELFGEQLSWLLCPVGDIAAMAATVDGIVGTGCVASSLHTALLDRAAKFSWSSHAQRLQDLWRSA